MSEESGSANLEKVDHIVVLMLENRSFDHTLGYLSLKGAARRPSRCPQCADLGSETWRCWDRGDRSRLQDH